MEPTDLRLVTDVAALAPSVHNTQPWRFTLSGHNVQVWADPSRQLQVLDPTGRQLHLSCGAAVEFARLAVRSLGYACTVRLLPSHDEPTLVATLTVGYPERPAPDEQRLIEAIPRRYTDRGAYDGQPLPTKVLQRIREAAAERGCWIRTLDATDDRVAALTLLAEAEDSELTEPGYVAELAAWRRPAPAADGVPTAAIAPLDADVVTDVPLRDFTAATPRPRPGRPGEPPRVERDTLVLLGTDADDTVSWLRAGRALGDVLLVLACAGLTAQPLGPVTDLPTTRLQLRRELGVIGYPQLLLRAGAGSRSPATGRRPCDEVLVEPTSA